MRIDAIRQNAITASEMPAIAGVDPFGNTPLTLYYHKLGLIDPMPDSPDLRWGRLIEAACIKAYEEDTGYQTVERDTTVHPSIPWIAGTPDRLVVGHDRGLEIKTVGFRHARDWHDGLPDGVRVQCAIYMAIFDVPVWDVGRLILATRDWQIVSVARDQELEELLIDAGREFRERYWLPQIVPPLDGSIQTSAYLAKKYPHHTDEMLVADESLLTIIEQYQRDRTLKAFYEMEMKLREAWIKERIGTYAGVTFPQGKITWKKSKDGEKTEWDAVVRDLKHRIPSAFHDVLDSLITHHTQQKMGSRSFLPTFTEEHE